MGNELFIDHLDTFRSLEGEWNEMYRDSRTRSPFLTHEFVDLWYCCFARPDQVRVIRAVDGGATVGFLPLVMGRDRGFRILSSLTNDHCFHSGALVRNGFEEVFPEKILSVILKHSTAWDLFRFSFTYSFSPYPGLFPDKLLEGTRHAWRRIVQPTYPVLLDRTFDDYFRNDLSSGTRRLVSRKKKLLAGAGRSSFLHFRGEEALRRWQEFVRIEDSGWKGEAGTSIARLDERYTRFYEGLLKILASKGDLHLYFLELDEKNIAGGFGYVEEHVFHWAKAGYDEEYRGISPSNLLLLHVVEDLLTNFPEMKMLHQFPWDYGYKHKFSNDAADCLETVVYNRTLRGRAARLYPAIKGLLGR
jgi:CelD/BcsL family acetyltransferase involved in cellulose biosynthesis